MKLINDFDPSDITTEKVRIVEYNISPYLEQIKIEKTCTGHEDEEINLSFADGGEWCLSSAEGHLLRDHVFEEGWDGNRKIPAIFYKGKIVAVKIRNEYLPLDCYGWPCIYFMMGVEFAKNENS